MLCIQTYIKRNVYIHILNATKSLTPEFQRALTRIFRICDKDCDNLLKDTELTEFQLEVFKGELTSNDIKGIKEVVKDEVFI
jgi:Ras family protein T1